MHDEVARVLGPRGEVVLLRRGLETLELRVNGVFVMDTAQTETEEEQAALALDLVASPARVLVGGLGLGFTTRRVLTDERVREVVVVEIEEAVITWLRDGTVPHGPALLADPRVQVVCADVAAFLTCVAPGSFNLVLLDVDNGPGHLVHESNAQVYGSELLSRTRDALTPGGTAAVWSADPAPVLLSAMESVFGSAEEHGFDVRLQARDEHYYLYVARLG